MTGLVVDLVLVLVLLGRAVAGYRRGLVATLLGAVGLLAGAGLCLWLLPRRLEAWVPDSFAGARPLLLLLAILGCAALGQGIAARLGRVASGAVRSSPIRGLDSALGSLVAVGVTALVMWFALGLVRVAAPAVGVAVGASRVLAAIDTVMPASSERVLGRVVVMLDSVGFPRVFAGLGAEPITPVEAPKAVAANAPAVARARESVLEIDALAVACGRSQEGTGWVAAPGLVVTNAHVVAGAERVTVRSGGRRLSATVVSFNPQKDLAVLSVADLAAPALQLGRQLGPGADAVVLGYPNSGPFHVEAARVRSVLTAEGDDIYGRGRVTRSVYSLRATIHPGNSGGPLLASDGTVSGVVFARSLDDENTAYALTLSEVRPEVQAASASRWSVGTGPCTT